MTDADHLAAQVDGIAPTNDIAGRATHGPERWELIKGAHDRRDRAISGRLEGMAVFFAGLGILAMSVAVAVLLPAVVAAVRWA